MSEQPAKLAQKLAAVMAAVHRVPKRGRNEFHKYDYATETDIAEVIRKELADRQVMLLPAILQDRRDSVGEKGSVLTTLVMEFTFIDGESGEMITRRWLGAGTDKEDKGVYKAMTGGEKYFLLKTFLIPTGDDPETETKQATKRLDDTRPMTRDRLPSGKADDAVDVQTGEVVEAPALPEGHETWPEDVHLITAVKVKRGIAKKNDGSPGREWVRYDLTTHRAMFSTFDTHLGDAAMAAKDERRPVQITAEQKSEKYAPSITEMVGYSQHAAEGEPF